MLDLGLAVVEVAAHRAHHDVVACLRRHLEVLDVGDLALGVEDGDAAALDAGESVQGGLAGVAGGGGDDHDLLALALGSLAGDAHELGQHLERDVFEGARRTVIELEQPVVAERGYRAARGGVPLLAVGRAHALRDLGFGVVGKKCAEHQARVFLEGLVADLGEVELFLADPVRDIEATVRGDSAQDSLLACYVIGFTARAVVERIHCRLLASGCYRGYSE